MTGHELRSKRLALRLTQLQLALLLGVSIGTICNWERTGTSDSKLSKLATISHGIHKRENDPPQAQ